MANPITYSEIKALLTRQDNYDASNDYFIDGQTFFPAGDPRQIPIDLKVYEYLKEKNDPRFRDTFYVDDESTSTPPEPIPDNGEEETPIYLVKSSVPGGIRGRIYFEFRQDGGNTSTDAIGEIYRDSYDTSEYTFPNYAGSSTDYNYRSLADDILRQWNRDIKLFEAVSELGVISIVETQTEPPQNFLDYSIRGKVIGVTNEGLGDVYITDDVKSVGLIGSNINSEPSGDFLLQGEYKKGEIFTISFSLEGYQSKTINPFTKTTNNISIIPTTLLNIKLDLALIPKSQIILQSPIPKLEIKKLEVKEKLKDPQGFFMDGLLQSIFKKISTQIIPFILQNLLAFGIANAKDVINKKIEPNHTCPLDLNKAIENFSKITSGLNQTYNRLNTVKTSIQFGDQILTVAQIVAQTLSALVIAFPTIPFSPNPTAPITTKIPTADGKFKDVLETISGILEKLKISSSSTLLILTLLIQKLQEALAYQGLLDSLLQECAVSSGIDFESQNQLSTDLLAATQEQEPPITSVNGFKMEVLSISGTGSSQLKRRQAIARNKAGVIMLRGDISFASNDQILIDQLVYYIKANNLKAD
jgi:hypothetical protein|tara:strand:+ start:1289 stop:3046 length:1758 start_codon:yes stop_codon:yes gene_type:complete